MMSPKLAGSILASVWFARLFVVGALLASLNAQGSPESPHSSRGLNSCSIDDAREIPGGVSLRFSEKMFWIFQDSLGGHGIIGVGGVVRLVERGEGKYDVMPAEPTIEVQSGVTLTLSDHHTACVILVDKMSNRVLLRIQRSFRSVTQNYEVML